MDKDEILRYLTQQIDLLQRRTVELQEQHDEIEKQLKAYKKLFQAYRTVYESEAGVGLLNRLPAEILEILEKKFANEETSSKDKVKKKTKKRGK
ncbi:hypothetical protein M1N05_02680 [Dehalococcoidales bacterium]|nr:hypothetical protein [Dehalococcoidales bacterium]